MSIDLPVWIAELERQDIVLWADGEQLRYRAPPGRMTADIRARLESSKEEVLDYLRGSRTFPLSFTQQRMWLLERVFPTKHLNHAAEAYELHGALDVSTLEQSVREIVRRHSLLRALLLPDAQPPTMSVSEQVRVKLALVDLSRNPSERQESDLRPLIRQEQNRPFDLLSESGFRPFLFRLHPDHHVLLLAYHHLYVDAWSSGLLFKELAFLYNASIRDSGATLPPLEAQYSDFAREQQRNRPLGNRESSEFWQQKLAGLTDELQLPYDYGLRSDWGQAGVVKSSLSHDLADGLRVVARRGAGSTLSSILLAGLATLFFGMSRQRDLVIGTVSGFRGAREYEDLIGPFLNVLPIRIRPQPDQTFGELLSEAQESASEAMANQEVPIEQYASASPAGREGAVPKIRVTLNVYNFPSTGAVNFDGIDTRRFPLDPVATYTDLEFVVPMADHRPTEIRCIYDATLFSRDTVERLSRAFIDTLDFAADRPDATLDQFPVPLIETRPIGTVKTAPDQSVPLRTNTEHRLAALWREVLGVETVNAEDSFFDLGGRSLAAVRLLERVREEFGCEPRIDVFFESPELSTMAACLDAHGDDRDPRLVLTLQDQGDASALFVVPGIGGAAFRLLPLAEAMGPTHPLHVFQSPGLLDLALIPETVAEMASAYVDAMREHQPAGPYCIAGYSYGGFIALEMARQLQVSGDQLGRVILLDTVASGVKGLYEPLGRAQRARFRLQQARSALMRPAKWIADSRIGKHVKIIRTIQPSDYHQYLLSTGFRNAARKHYNELNPRSVPKASPRYRRIATAHWQAIQRYRFEPVDFPIELIASSRTNRYSVHGWNLLCSRVHKTVVSGTHTSMMNPPSVQEVSRVLKALVQ